MSSRRDLLNGGGDQWIDARMVAGFGRRCAKRASRPRGTGYEAGHGFANPTTARCDEADAKLAWERTIAFLDGVLSGSALVRPGIASAA